MRLNVLTVDEVSSDNCSVRESPIVDESLRTINGIGESNHIPNSSRSADVFHVVATKLLASLAELHKESVDFVCLAVKGVQVRGVGEVSLSFQTGGRDGTVPKGRLFATGLEAINSWQGVVDTTRIPT